MIKLYGMGSPNVVKVYVASEELGLTQRTGLADAAAQNDAAGRKHAGERDQGVRHVARGEIPGGVFGGQLFGGQAGAQIAVEAHHRRHIRARTGEIQDVGAAEAIAKGRAPRGVADSARLGGGRHGLEPTT